MSKNSYYMSMVEPVGGCRDAIWGCGDAVGACGDAVGVMRPSEFGS